MNAELARKLREEANDEERQASRCEDKASRSQYHDDRDWQYDKARGHMAAARYLRDKADRVERGEAEDEAKAPKPVQPPSIHQALRRLREWKESQDGS
jgi:hypothetical protein